VTQAPDGSLIDARHSNGELFHFKPVEAATSVMDVKSVFPRRGRLAGGSKLMIFGVNFAGPVIVMVGDKPCLNPIVVSTSKIECTLPAANAPGRVNVKVTTIVNTSTTTTDTFVNGYRYITGKPSQPCV
jgi:IPT/TIG domain